MVESKSHLNRDDAMIFLRAILIAAILVCSSAAFAEEIDCASIRAKVAEHGKSTFAKFAFRPV